MRRHLNGKYRACTDPEIIDALLFYFIGVFWQLKLKSVLRRLFNGKAWKRSLPHMHELQEKYKAQLRADDRFSIGTQRNKCRRDSFFVSQLADSPTCVGTAVYYDNMIKQQLLHSMTTECYLNMALHGTHATICSDLEWFGPSLPHTSIMTVLEFLGMPQYWLSFFKAFLAMPVRFSEDAEPRVRKRGTPLSYGLSTMCGETILFVMDFAVNQRADGLHLYRMHDDLWLWDADANKCAAGWEEMDKYAGLVGLEFNKTKTGSAYVRNPTDDKPSRLPDGDVRWGFLKFEPSQSRFAIDQKEVDDHIVELRRQLTATKSVFDWVNTYNTYMSFLLRNFGGIPANCMGQKHANDIIGTLGRIQRDLFAETGDGSAVSYLRRILHERFDIDDLPEGYFYFPISSGGLELRNTMLEVLSLSVWHTPFSTFPFNDKDAIDNLYVQVNGGGPGGLGSVVDSDLEVSSAYASHDSDSADYNYNDVRTEEATSTEALFSRNIQADRRRYAKLKEKWDLDIRKKWRYNPDIEEFMSFPEYISLRESWLSTWGKTYEFMFDSPSQRDMVLVPHVKAEIENGSNTGSKPWVELTWYEKWVMSMYGEEVVKKFGRLEAVDPNLIPIGMVQLFKTSRMKLYQ